MEYPKTISLPSGTTATIAEPFKGKHLRKAMQMINGDTSLMMFAMIHLLVKIDGVSVPMEELDEMDGGDVFALLEEVGTSFLTLNK